MRRFVTIVSVFAVLAGLAVMVMSSSFPSHVQVEGNLSDREVVDIKRAVRQAMKSEYCWPNFSGFSWENVREAALGLRFRLSARILSIERRTDVFVVVMTGLPEHPQRHERLFWSVFREPGRWEVRLGGRR